MKTIILQLFLNFISILTINAQSNSSFKKNEILKNIKESKKELQQIIALGHSKKPPISFSSNSYRNQGIQPLKKLLSESHLSKKLKLNDFDQVTLNNKTIFIFNWSEIYELHKYDNSINITAIELKNIRFYDNTTSKKAFNSKELKSSDFKDLINYSELQIPLSLNRKRVKSADLLIHIKTDEFSHFHVNRSSKEQHIEALNVSNLNFDDNHTITYTQQEPKTFSIYAIKDSLWHKSTANSSVTKLTESDKIFYTKIIQLYDLLIEKINNEEIKSENELKEFYTKNAPKQEETSNSIKYNIYEYKFPVKTNQLVFRQKNKEHEFIIQSKFTFDTTSDRYFASKADSHFKGFVNNKGKWILKPTYQYIEPYKFTPNYYETNRGSLWLSKNNKTSKDFDFTLEAKMIAYKWVAITDVSSKKKTALFDTKTQKFIIPFEHNLWIDSFYDFYISKKYNKNSPTLQALYDRDGTLIFSLQEQSFKITNDTLFKRRVNNSDILYSYNHDNKQLTKLTKRTYSDINDIWFKDGKLTPNILRAKHKNKTTVDYIRVDGSILIDGTKYLNVSKTFYRYIVQHKNNTYSLLDDNGKLVKNLDSDLIPATEIVCKALKVKSKKTGLFGYLNDSGEFIIPCQYKSATRFVKNKAIVNHVKNNIESSYYIDLQNNRTLIEQYRLDKQEEQEIEIKSNY